MYPVYPKQQDRRNSDFKRTKIHNSASTSRANANIYFFFHKIVDN